MCTSRVGQYVLDLSCQLLNVLVCLPIPPSLDCVPEGLQLPWLLQHHRGCGGHFGGEGERREEKVTAPSLKHACLLLHYVWLSSIVYALFLLQPVSVVLP